MTNTAIKLVKGGHDAPIRSIAEDLYGSIGLARAIHRVLRSAPSAWSTRVALYGSWGSGKTSVLNLLEELETKDKAIIVRFSAWAASGQAGIIAMFYSTLAERLARENIRAPWLARVRVTVGKNRVLSWLTTLGKGAEATGQAPPGTGELLTAAADLASEWVAPKKADVDALVNQLNGRRVVVFVDDLDRADPAAIPKTLLAFRELLDWPSFAFVLAFDKGVVGRALGEYSKAYGENAEGFLEKIVDFPFTIPVPSPEQQRALATQAFAASCEFVPAQVIHDLAALLPREPRRVKLIGRCLGALQDVVARHGPEEIDWTGLLLHAILDEASQRCADAVVARSTSERSEVASLLAAEDEGNGEKHFRTEMAALLPEGTSEPERSRVLNAAVRLQRHWEYIDADRIRYHLRLRLSNPPITWREFNRFAEELATTKSDGVVLTALSAIADLGFKRDFCSQVLLDFSIQSYRSVLSQMAEERTSAGWKAALEQAGSRLGTLEYLWTTCSLPEVIEARKSAKVCIPLIALIPQWIAWTRNEGEENLRAREQALANRAAAGCLDAGAIYDSTDPYWNSSVASDPLSARLMREWNERLRASLAPAIVADLTERLRRPSGIDDVAAGEPQILTWFVESPKSPIYNVQAYAESVAQCFAEHESADSLQPDPIQQNAITYLRMLLFKTRNASWGGASELPRIVAAAPQLIACAWSAAVRHTVPFRMVGSLQQLRSDLVKHGVSADALTIPPWLVEATERLQARLAESGEETPTVEQSPD